MSCFAVCKEDKDQNCADYKSLGDCKPDSYWYEWMLSNCYATCGKCNSK